MKNIRNNTTIRRLYIITIPFLLFACLYVGCDSQKNFKPEHIRGTISFNNELQKPIVATNNEGAKLKNNQVITTSEELGFMSLESQENFIYQDSHQFLVANGCKTLRIIPLKNQNGTISLDREKTQEIETQGCVVSASIKETWVAGVLGDNTIFLYDLVKHDFIFREKGESIYAIFSSAANPVFLDTLVIFPTLDGRLNTVDIQKAQSVKNIIINTEKFLNNIIYLKVKKDELVSATQKRLYTLIRGESYTKDLEIRDIYFDGKYIYVLSLNGIIYQFDKTLSIVHSIKLPYANLNGILIKDEHLYTFENSGGFLIKLHLSDFHYEVFKLKFGMERWFSKKATIFYTNSILYINKKILDFNKDYIIRFNNKKPKKKSNK